MAHKIAMVAIALILVLSAVSVVASASTGSGQNQTQLGDYSFFYSNSTSTITNLTYQNDNANAMVATTIKTNGNATNTPATAGSDASHLMLNNVTLSALSDGKALIFSTAGASLLNSPSMVFSLNGNVSNTSLGLYQRFFLQKVFNGGLSPFVTNQIYKVQANNTTFFMFANTQSSVNSNTVSYKASGATSISRLVVMIVPASVIINMFGSEMEHRYNASFTYNNTTGMLSGQFVTMQFNQSAGTITNYTDANANMTIFNRIWATGNGTTSGNVYTTMQPIVLRSLFYYADNTVQYQVHDNPVMLSNYAVTNGTLSFNVSSSLNLTLFNPPKEQTDHGFGSNVTTDGVGGGTAADGQGDNGFQSSGDAQSSTMIFLSGNGFRGNLFINGGNVTVNGSTVTVTTNSTAKASFIAPPGLQNLKRPVEDALHYAITHSKLAALLVLGSPGTASTNLSLNYNNSINLTVQNISAGSIHLRVSSAVHTGNNIAIYIPNSVINNNTKIALKFDNQTITFTKNAGATINSSSTTHASFYTVTVESGTLVIVHIPHFSTHTIEIVNASTVSNGGGLPSLPGGTLMYAAVGIVVLIAIIGGVAVSRRGKAR